MQRRMLAGLAIAVLAGCGVTEAARQATTAPTIAPPQRGSITGRLAGGGEAQDGAGTVEWTQAALDALQAEGVTLLSAMPADVMQFCPGYATQTRENRAAFWAGLVSAVAQRDAASEARKTGRLPLVSISLPTARANGCGGSMSDTADNARCAVRIMARAVARDGAIAGETGTGAGSLNWKGLARNWMSLRSERQRGEIARWTTRQSYCR